MPLVKFGLDVLLSIFSVMVLSKFFDTFFEKEKRWTRWLGWGAYVGWQIVTLFEKNIPATINIAIAILLALVVSFTAYKGNFLKKITFSILFNVIAMLMEILCGYIFMTLNVNYTILQLTGSFISKMMLFLVVFFLNRVFIKVGFHELPTNYNLRLLFIPIGSIFVINNMFRLSNAQNTIGNSILSLASSIIMLIINIVIFTVYIRLAEEMEFRRYNAVYEQQLELYDKHVKEREAAMIEFQNARHDMKQKLFVLLEMAKMKRNDEIIDYLNNLISKSTYKMLGIAQTGNIAIDSLLNHMYTLATEEEKVNFSIELHIPDHFPFQSKDICVILGNALDNALEAVKRVKDQEKYIKFFMKYDKNNLSIIITNSFDGYVIEDGNGNLRTIKGDEVNHGIGLQSIKKIVDKYQGVVLTEYVDNEFTLKLLLYAQQ